MPPRISPVGSNQSALSPSAILGLPPTSANDGTVLPAVQTYDAVGRIVLGQTTAQGTSGSYVRIRASAGGAILNTATVGVGATSLTVLNRGAGTAAQYTTQIEAWMELVVTAATVSMLSSATINDIGADNTANVFARFATPTSAAEAVTQRAYVFETDDPSLTFYEATPQTVYGAGTASCGGVVTFYDVAGGMPAFVFAGSTDTTADGIRGDGSSYTIYRGGVDQYQILTTAASPALANQSLWTVSSGTAPAPTVLGVTYDVEVASRVQWPIQSAVLLADFPKTNDTLTAVPDLTLNLEAGHWYRVDFTCSLLPDAGYADVDFAGGTVTATGVGGAYTSFDGNLLTFGGGVISILGVLVTNGDNSGELGWVSGSFVVQVNAGGTLILRFAQASTNAAAATLLKYSTIQAIDVTP